MNLFRRLSTPPPFPDSRTPEGRYELFRWRARWFVLRAFEYELAWQRGLIPQPVTLELFQPERGVIPPGETLEGWVSPAPRDPFEPVRPIVIHETQGSSRERSHRWFTPLNPAGLGVA